MPKFLAVPALVEEDLVLPIAGRDGVVREYAIKPATMEQYLILQAIQVAERGGTIKGTDLARLEAIDDFDHLHATNLGADVVKAMTADGISATDFRRATQTAFQWHVTGGDEAAAEEVWSGKAQSPPSGTTPSDEAGAEADTTSDPASTPDTTTPPDTSSTTDLPTTDGTTSGDAST